jgi:cytochrome c oxidase accessory protein FixG
MAETRVNPTIEGRSVLSTLNDDGTRRWIRPRLSLGRFLTARRVVAYGLILIFTAAPYLRADGQPLFLLDVTARRFTVFGHTFLPTDTLLLALMLVGVFVAIFLATALLGRVWCGWACPQTVYMEFVYRPIERLFEGAPGRTGKGLIRGTALAKPLKFFAYLAVSMFLAHTFLAWFVGVDRLLEWVQGSPAKHPVGFAVMAATTGLMLFDFGFFREQMCLVTCPYGRFQSVMLDRDSLIVSYDATRGEPRGKAGTTTGDCVDCRLCVATCPTGIDIRNGLQMECIACTQCIDACDAVMTRLERPTGLIRYSSQAAMAGERRRIIRPRIVLYPLILLAVSVAWVLTFRSQGLADITVLRGMGRPFVQLAGGEVSNPVRIKIVNRGGAAATFEIAGATPGLRIVSESPTLTLEPGSNRTVPAELILPGSAFDRGSRDVQVRISAGEFSRTVVYRMLGPGNAGGEIKP